MNKDLKIIERVILWLALLLLIPPFIAFYLTLVGIPLSRFSAVVSLLIPLAIGGMIEIVRRNR